MQAAVELSFLDTQLPIGDVSLNSPRGIATDSTGNVYVADSGNNRILKVPSTPSGFGTAVTILDNLSDPGGIAVDWNGDLYVTDSGNNRVLKLTATKEGFGSPVTVASGLNHPSGIAIDSAGNLFVADTGNNRVVELPALGSALGAPISIGSDFSAPRGVAVDLSRNLLVADTGNNRIVKLTLSSSYTSAKTLFKNFTAPAGIAVDAAYDLFVSATGNQKVVEETWFAAANRYNTTLTLGNGFSSPSAVATDLHGNVFIVDSSQSQLWEIPSTPLAFPAAAASAQANWQLYNYTVTAGTSIGSVAVLTQGAAGMDFTQGSASTCIAGAYTVTTICSVQVQFSPLASGVRSGAVILYDMQGSPLATSYLSGTGIAARASFFPAAQISLGTQLSNPSGVAVDGAGNLFVADTGNNRIVEIPFSNGAYGDEIPLPVAQLSEPMGIAFDGAGNLYITSSGNDKVLRLQRTSSGLGAPTKIPIAVYVPTAVNVDSNGTLYIADTYENRIVKLPWTGTGYGVVHMVGGYVKMPMGVAIANNGDTFFSLPYLNNLAWVPWQSGKYLPQRSIVTSRISFPTSVVTDSNSNLYLLDSGNNEVVMYPSTSSGYGDQITVATGFNMPVGMTIDGNNNLYVADSGNNRIVKINLGQPAALSFQSTYVGVTSQDSAQYTTIQNTGDQSINISSLTFPADFPEDSGATQTCVPGESVDPGTGCQLAVDFLPQAVGTLGEAISLAISSADGETSPSIPASGIANPRQPQSINFPALPDMVYGASPIRLQASSTSGLPIAFQVVSGPAALTSNNRLTVTGAGTVVVMASQPGNSIYEAATPVSSSFTVAPATLTVTPNSVSAIYGAIPSNFAYTVSGLLPGQSLAQAVTGLPVIAVSGSFPAGVGTHSLIASLGTLKSANYIFAFATGTLVVKPATLRISAEPKMMSYGSELPKFTWTAKGFVNTDTASTLQGAPEFATPANSHSPVGTYTITPFGGTLKGANYTFVYVGSTLTVSAATLTLTAQNQSMVYGSALPNLTFTITGFQGADTAASALTGSPVFTTGAGPHAKVGQYALVPSLGTLKSPNYTFHFVNGLITIVPAPLTVRPATVTSTYGQSIPLLKNLQLEGLVNGDTTATALTGSPVLTTDATSASPPGSMVINIQKGTLTSLNYTLHLQPGVLVITKGSLTVTPVPVSRRYGSANPAISYTIAGFLNGDTAAQLSGSPVISTSATIGSPAGVYPITASVGSLSSSKYAFTFGTASVTVTKAPLTITADTVTISYGTALPALQATMSGFVNGDTSAVINGTPLVSTTAAAVPSAGSYSIAVNVSKLAAANYTFTAVAGTLTVTKVTATIKANDESMTVGNNLPTLAYTVSGLVNNDQASVAISGAPALATTATKSSAVGTYPITITNGTMASKNYTLAFVGGTLTIAQPSSSVVNPNPVTPRLPNKHLP